MGDSGLRSQDWEALGRLITAIEPLLTLSWDAAGITQRLIDAGYAERVRAETGLPYLTYTGIGRTAMIRWLRKQITSGAKQDLVLFRSGHKLRLNAKVRDQLTSYGLLRQHGSLTITHLGHLVATAPPEL